jgi:predicted phage tail protein
MTRQIAGASGAGCFLGHTLVRTPSGPCRIDELRPDDLVLSFDDAGEIHEAKVLKVHVHQGERVVRYRLWGGGVLDATPNHWVLNQFNAFVEIGTLEDDDCVVDENGHLRPIVSRAELCAGTVYNLTVEGHHTFIAGGIRVHNAGLGPGIAGSSGSSSSKGGGGSYTPKTEKDSLNSSAFARIVDLLGEGEIEGFPSAREYTRDSATYETAMLKDIYFNKTPILRPSANDADPRRTDYNFKDVKIKTRWGTQDQNHIRGFGKAETEFAVGVVVRKDEPVTRTISDTDVDRVRITLNFPALQKIGKKGDIKGVKVEYRIRVAYNGGGFETVVEDTVNGRSGDLYQRKRVIDLDGPFPVEVRVVRVTDDSDDPKLSNEFSWSSYTEIVDAKLRYPNSALVGLEVNARDFSSIPTRSYRVRGLKIRIPTNATVDPDNGRLIYTGTWDGTFSPATWCSDPAWCLWDLLTDCRYGFGQHIHARHLDKWAFYQASVYCSALVPDGLGGKEPRFSCNVLIQNIAEAYKLINDMCSVFRAMPYWGAGTLVIAQDRPSDAVYLFNQTNVSEEGFQYSGSSLKTRHTVAVVGYLDVENQETAYEAVEDLAGIARYGVVTTEVTAFACTSRSQAYRVGEWLLYTEQNETETVTFKAAMDSGVAVRPGMVIAVSDMLRAGARRGGRIVTAGSNFVGIDEAAATNLPLGSSPQIMVAMADGTVVTKGVAGVSGSTISISGPWSDSGVLPLVGGAFIYNDNSMAASKWRVLSVQEQNGAEYVISAISYNASKYAYIERGKSLIKKTYLPLTVQAPADPQNVSSEVVSYESNGQLQTNLAISWQSDPTAVQYEVRYRVVD